MAISNKKAEFSDISRLFDAGWVTSKETNTTSLISPNQFAFSIKCSRAAYTAVNNTTGQTRTMRSLQEAADWISGMNKLMCAVDKVYVKHSQNAVALNSNLSAEAATRIKTVFKTAQDAVDLPKGFRYTAFRTNSEENVVISTLMYTSAKLGATQWVMKSGLMGAFEGEIEEGRRNDIIEHDSWAFQPDYDINRVDSGREDYVEKEADKIYNFKPTGDTPAARDKQAAYWLVGLLSDVLDNILDNPPNRVYEFFLADGLLHKKDLSRLTMVGLLRLLDKGAVTGPEVLKAKPSIWKKLLEKDYITPEQALKSQPEQLAWLTIHNYIPVERALKIDPSITKKLARAGIMIDDVDNSDILTDVDSLIGYVTDGVLTPQKAWTLNDKVLRPLVESGLIAPDAAYKLDPSILNWLLENHYIGREEATRLKPTIKKEMTRKGVDWETLDAAKNLNSERAATAYFQCFDDVYAAIYKATFDDDEGWWELSCLYEDEPTEGTSADVINYDISSEIPNTKDVYNHLKDFYDSVEQISKREALGYVSTNSSKNLNAAWVDIEPSWHDTYPDEVYGDDYDDYEDEWEPVSDDIINDPDGQIQTTTYFNAREGIYVLMIGDEAPSEEHAETYSTDLSDIEYYIQDWNEQLANLNSSKTLNAGWDYNDDIGWYDPYEQEQEEIDNAWSLRKYKTYIDSEGWQGEYYWFYNNMTGEHIFMADSEEPDPDYADWTTESEEEAAEWFDNYGNDDLDSSRQSNSKTQEPANEAAKLALENQIRAKVRAVMTGPDFGFDNSEADSYSAVEVSETDDGRVRVEVRADVTYDGLMQLAEALNPIVQKYDKDSYFDAVTGGVIDAYIENAAQKLNSLDFQSTSWTR